MFMGSTGNQILTFAFGVILARLLAPEVFGLLLTIQVFTGIAGFVAGGGMGQALVRARDTTRADYDLVFTLQFIIGCVIYTFFFLTAPFIAAWYDNPLYSDLIRISALSFLFRPLNNVPANILHRDMRFKGMTFVKLASLIVSSGVSILFAWQGFGVWSLIFGGLAGPLVTIPAFMWLARWRPRFTLRLERAKEIARYGFLVSVTDILVFLRSRASTFIMSITLGPTAIGLYSKGESLAGMPNAFITSSVSKVLLRALAVEQESLDKSRYLFFRSIMLVAVYATPFYVGLLWIAEPLVRGIYGPRWAEAATPLFILVFAWPFWLLDMLSGAVLAAFAWLHREVVSQTATLLVTILAILIGLQMGITGIAWALVASAFFSATYMLFLSLSCLHARWLEVLSALLPALILNSLLSTLLLLANLIWQQTSIESDLLYVAYMSVAGTVAYITLFILLPIKSLATERSRWTQAISSKAKTLIS